MIGEKTRKIEIWRPDPTVDTANESFGWVFVRERWAQIVGETGMGRIRTAGSAGGIMTPLNRYSFRVAYDFDIDVTMQVREKPAAGGATYNILSVLHDKARRKYTDIVCELGGANG